MCLFLTMVALGCNFLTSCGSDSDSNDNNTDVVSDLYYCDVSLGSSQSRQVYYFVNHNTVESYGNITQDANTTWLGQHGESFPYKAGWYYWPGNKSTMTYYIVDGRIVMTNGTILIINGNTLLLDGSSNVYYKWN